MSASGPLLSACPNFHASLSVRLDGELRCNHPAMSRSFHTVRDSGPVVGCAAFQSGTGSTPPLIGNMSLIESDNQRFRRRVGSPVWFMHGITVAGRLDPVHIIVQGFFWDTHLPLETKHEYIPRLD